MGKRDISIDILKIIACIAVVLIHITSDAIFKYTQGSELQIFVVILNSIVKFAVPCFVFLSGYALFRTYKYKKIYYKEFIKKRLSVILVPYIIWTVIYYFLYVYRGYYPLSIPFFIKGLILGDMSYHLYFMVIIIQFYLLFKWLKHWVERVKTVVGLPIIAVFQIVYVLALMQYIPKSDRLFLSYIIFFMCGMYYEKHKTLLDQMLKKYMLVFTGLYIVLAGSYSLVYVYIYSFDTYIFKYTNFLWYDFSLASIIITIYISKYMSEKLQWKGSNISLASKATFYVYLSHPLLLVLLNFIYDNIQITSVSLQLLLNFIMIVIVCFYLAISYIKLREKKAKNLGNNVKYL